MLSDVVIIIGFLDARKCSAASERLLNSTIDAKKIKKTTTSAVIVMI